MTEEDLMQRYPPCADTGLSTTDYVIELTYRDPFAFDPIYCDAADEQKSNVARFLNHGTNAASHNVRKEYQRFPTRRIRFFTARDIKVGEELQWDYGADYWIGREDLMSE
uniref:SET domain-containing protein n=1 Tax=Octactis speculum TaxID=3111310 RepID=A0A7S2B2U6_9STRA